MHQNISLSLQKSKNFLPWEEDTPPHTHLLRTPTTTGSCNMSGVSLYRPNLYLVVQVDQYEYKLAAIPHYFCNYSNLLIQER